MRHLFRKHPAGKRLRAQGLVEFALILPVLMLLLFGLIDMGWMMFNFAELYNAVREGVRYGSVTGFPASGAPPNYENCDAIRARIVSLAGYSGITASKIQIFYDDGRPMTSPLTEGDTHEVGNCNGTTFANNGSYAPQAAYTPPRLSPLQVENGDRIEVQVDVNVHFLTPFIAAIAPNGVRMYFVTSRTVFPGGLAAQLEQAQAPQF